MTNDGKPYGPILYRRLVKEAYYITKNTSTSYSEVLDMTPTERKLMLDFLTEEFTKQQESLEKSMAKNKAKK
jgi:hypothetical protein